MRLRPTWPERLATPFGKASLRECSSSRGVSIACAASTKTLPEATPSLPSQRLKRMAVTRPSVPTSTFVAVVCAWTTRAVLLRHRHMNGRVVFRSDRADRDAARIAAAGRPPVATHRIAGLRRGAQLVLRAGKGPRIGLVQEGLRDGRHRVAGRAWRTERLAGIARDPDLVLGLAVERLELIVTDRPVDPAAMGGAETKIVRHEAEAGAEPMPRRAADHLEIGAFEFVRPRLPVPVIRIVADRVIGLRRWRIRTFRDPDRCVPEALPGFRTIDSGTCLEDGDLHAGGRQLRGEKRARDARPDNDHISFNVGHGWRQP